LARGGAQSFQRHERVAHHRPQRSAKKAQAQKALESSKVDAIRGKTTSQFLVDGM
jgi:hypothetical protein